MSIASRVIVATLLPFAACCWPLQAIGQQPTTIQISSHQSDQRFLGQWVFMVGKRTMMVLDLQPGAGGQPVTGTLTDPKHFQTQNF